MEPKRIGTEKPWGGRRHYNICPFPAGSKGTNMQGKCILFCLMAIKDATRMAPRSSFQRRLEPRNLTSAIRFAFAPKRPLDSRLRGNDDCQHWDRWPGHLGISLAASIRDCPAQTWLYQRPRITGFIDTYTGS